MLIIKLSCTVNSKYIFDSKYEMGFKLLNVFSSSEARGGKACVTKQGLMVTALLKLQKIPLDLTVTLFTNYDMQDSLDFFHCMINHKQTYPMLSTSSRRETDFS